MKPIYPILSLILATQLAACTQSLRHQQESNQAIHNNTANDLENDSLASSDDLNVTEDNVQNTFNNLTASEPDKQPVTFWGHVNHDILLSETVQHQDIDKYRRQYEKYPDNLQLSLNRAEPFLFLIAQQIRQKNMPIELLFLPVIESNYDPYAYSHGRASGIWQMINMTATRLGVQNNWWYDGRRDIVVSTQAALDYLEFLHNEFDGDWLLAVAAYNAGEGTVARAQRANKKKGLPTDFWSLRLPRETSAYVPKWLALSQHMKQVLANPETANITLPGIINETHLTTVEMKSQIDLSLAAKLSGISLRDLYQYNPGYNHWATPPEGPHSLLLPTDAADALVDGLKDYPAEKRVTWIRYTIKSGDSLGKLARQYKTTIDTIQTVNHLSGTQIVAGKQLIIPKSSKYAAIAGDIPDDNLDEGKLKIQYTVASGDNLWNLARKYKVSTRDIAESNQISLNTPLQIGQELVIWQDPSQAGIAAQKQIRPEVMRKIYYPVRRGDSLASIAKKFKVTTSSIKKWNVSRHALLKPGQSLTLYVDVTQQFIGL